MKFISYIRNFILFSTVIFCSFLVSRLLEQKQQPILYNYHNIETQEISSILEIGFSHIDESVDWVLSSTESVKDALYQEKMNKLKLEEQARLKLERERAHFKEQQSQNKQYYFNINAIVYEPDEFQYFIDNYDLTYADVGGLIIIAGHNTGSAGKSRNFKKGDKITLSGVFSGDYEFTHFEYGIVGDPYNLSICPNNIAIQTCTDNSGTKVSFACLSPI